MSIAWHEIRDHLMHVSSTLNFQRSFDTIRSSQVCISPFRDPAAVLDALHRGDDTPDQKNLILAALVGVAQSNDPVVADCALTLLLLALWPGLDATRRRSIWRRLGSTDEIISDILARTTEAIRNLDLDRVNRIAATVLKNVERDMIRARQREAERDNAASDVGLEDVPAEFSTDQLALAEIHLRTGLHRLIGVDTLLVIRVALEGFSQAETAIELGLTEAAARKRYQRAIRRLRSALQDIV